MPALGPTAAACSGRQSANRIAWISFLIRASQAHGPRVTFRNTGPGDELSCRCRRFRAARRRGDFASSGAHDRRGHERHIRPKERFVGGRQDQERPHITMERGGEGSVLADMTVPSRSSPAARPIRYKLSRRQPITATQHLARSSLTRSAECTTSRCERRRVRAAPREATSHGCVPPARRFDPGPLASCCARRPALARASIPCHSQTRVALKKQQKSPYAGLFYGRYWARTSDPQLVELVLSQLS
jgi:hypothetical protein